MSDFWRPKQRPPTAITPKNKGVMPNDFARKTAVTTTDVFLLEASTDELLLEVSTDALRLE